MRVCRKSLRLSACSSVYFGGFRPVILKYGDISGSVLDLSEAPVMHRICSNYGFSGLFFVDSVEDYSIIATVSRIPKGKRDLKHKVATVERLRHRSLFFTNFLRSSTGDLLRVFIINFSGSENTTFFSLAILIPLLWILWSPELRAQSPGASRSSARSLDALLQDYAYRAFVHPRTGTPFVGNVPSNLSGIRVSAMRLRSGSLRSRGVKSYNEFEIPVGVLEEPYVERLVLVYQNLGNWSFFYYPLHGYTYLAPVLGLLAYNASNLSATNLPELDIRASTNHILIKFMDLKMVPDGSTAKCVWFDLHGLVEFRDVLSGNICSTVEQGHFSIVVESTAPSPAPVSPTPKGMSPGGGKKDKSKVWIIVGSVLGGLLLLVLLSFLILWLRRYKHGKKMQQMEKEAEVGEALKMALIRNTRAPVAMGTRTQPVLENEYVP
ncbi:hypothetical protein HHK36_015992 [Tetracentron sinense]|uniref:Uncharacterized protein n=1 Tax=Tetracentron sinense TaxID=13715 RepID=A0A834YYY3_TETSI|nr:hypothetical protein HHK36_015992 [Tetracentron sinense]